MFRLITICAAVVLVCALLGGYLANDNVAQSIVEAVPMKSEHVLSASGEAKVESGEDAGDSADDADASAEDQSGNDSDVAKAGSDDESADADSSADEADGAPANSEE